ncbi:hypothetical protein ACHQM5_004097 [Ranunculus cassubicifolius]
MAPTHEILYISSEEDDVFDNDYCVILDEDPCKPVNVSTVNASEELLIVSEKGQVACRDYPHARHLCAIYPFTTNQHVKHCDMCHCYVCDTPAPCAYWGTGTSTGDHCHSNDKADIWRQQRELFKKKRIAENIMAVRRVVSSRLSVRNLVKKSTGIVTLFDTCEGHGFITPDNGGEELYFRHSSIKSDGRQSLEEGEAVEFQIFIKQAINVYGLECS